MRSIGHQSVAKRGVLFACTFCLSGFFLFSAYLGGIDRAVAFLRGEDLFVSVEGNGQATASSTRSFLVRVKSLTNHQISIHGAKAGCSCAILKQVPRDIAGFGEVIVVVDLTEAARGTVDLSLVTSSRKNRTLTCVLDAGD